jgi:hypothetical protein
MDLNLRLIHAKDFLKMTPTGELDLETSKRLILKFALENGSPGQYDVLIDTRQTIGRLTLFDMAELVNVMIEHRESFRSKVAVLTSPDYKFEHAKFMELYANNRGFQIGAFDDFEKAMNWLMNSNDLIEDA